MKNKISISRIEYVFIKNNSYISDNVILPKYTFLDTYSYRQLHNYKVYNIKNKCRGD